MPGTVLTVASGKGGVGKTTTAVNLAVALWREGNAVALVDADLGMANLAAVLSLEPGVTLHDVLSGDASLEEAVVEAKDGDLLVLPGESDLPGFASADPSELRVVTTDLAERCDYVVVDTGAGLSYEDVLPLGLADEILLVTTPDPAAAGDTRKTLQLAGLLDGRVLGVVVTRTREDTDAESVATEIGVDLLGTVPEDPAVTESTTRGDPLESHAPDSPATMAYRDLAAAVASRVGPSDDSRGGGAVDEGEPTDGVADDDRRATESAGSTPAPGPGSTAGAAADETAAEGETGDGPDGEGDAAGEGGEDTDGGAIEDSDGNGAPDGSDVESDETDASTDGREAESGEAGVSTEGDDVPGDEGDDDAPDGQQDVEAKDEVEEDVGDDDGEDVDEDDEVVEVADEEGDADGEKRGGFFGWLGRLFS